MRISLNIDQETFDNTNSTFEPVPVGTYPVNIYSVEVKEVAQGPNAGKPRLNFQFRIEDGATAPDGSKQANRRLFAGVNAFPGINKKTGAEVVPFDLIGIAKAIGLGADALNDIDTDEWTGERLYVTIDHEEKMTKESGYKESFVPAQYRERVRSYRSVDSMETAGGASAAVTSAAGTKASGKRQYSLA